MCEIKDFKRFCLLSILGKLNSNHRVTTSGKITDFNVKSAVNLHTFSKLWGKLASNLRQFVLLWQKGYCRSSILLSCISFHIFRFWEAYLTVWSFNMMVFSLPTST